MASPFKVAIVGGGLCGISLAIALDVRGIECTIYEARSSFTEIGAGINLGPSALNSMKLIKPSLGELVYRSATRNPPPYDEVFMHLRYGADSGSHFDGDTVCELKSPPTGNLSVSRQELLQLLGDELGPGRAEFNKKLVGYEQNDSGVTIQFADGTEETASVLVGCDGIHSRVRAKIVGESNDFYEPQFHKEGVYRAVIPMDKAIEAIGDSARRSQIFLMPNGYFITYPIDGARAVNCGAWARKKAPWERKEWVIPNQKHQLHIDLKDCGENVHRMMRLFGDDTAFWATHQHSNQPRTLRDGRVIVIGDGAHAMPPHMGAGAGQAVEDAYVLSEVLQLAKDRNQPAQLVENALRAVEEIRKPRSSRVHKYSSQASDIWFDFYSQKREGQELEDWIKTTMERFEWIWHVDMETEAAKAKQLFESTV